MERNGNGATTTVFLQILLYFSTLHSPTKNGTSLLGRAFKIYLALANATTIG
jgi:hypothetical protein